MHELRWEKPAEESRPSGNRKWAEVVETLKTKPGEWAVVAEEQKDRNLASYLKKAHPGVEAVSRGRGSVLNTIYARWVGSADA